MAQRAQSVRGPWPEALVVATVFACAGALAAVLLGLGGAAAISGACLLAALRSGAGPFLAAVPAAWSACAPPEQPPAWPPPGPARFTGVVEPGIRQEQDRTVAQLEQGGHRFLLVLAPPAAVLPGDHVAGVGRVGPQAARRRDGRLPVVEADPSAIVVEPAGSSLPRVIDALRLRLQHEILRLWPEHGPLLASLGLGRGPSLPEDLIAAHRATGLSHLLAVSGAHVAVLVALLGALGRPGSRRRRWPTLLALCAYAAITGGEPPVVRALASYALVCWARATGRRMTLAAALAAPALLTAFVQPRELLSASFQLSYAAVLGLSYAGARRETFLQRWLLSPLRASCLASLMTMPLTLWWFGQWAPWTIVTTPLLAPVVGLLLVGTLALAPLAGVLPAAAALVAPALGAVAGAYSSAVLALANLPFAPVFAAQRPAAGVLLAVLCAAAAAWAWRPRRGTLLLASCLLSLPHFLPPAPAAPGLVLLAVGHGQACLLSLPDGRTALVDCGSLGDPPRAAHAVAQALLPRRRLELLVLSHADSDHTNGVPVLLQLVEVAEAWLPPALRGSETERVLRRRRVAVRFAGSGLATGSLQVHAPRQHGSDNDQSLWTRVEFGEWSALLPGDAEEAGVDAALQQGLALPAEVLLLPHHGREHARAGQLLLATRPALALVSNQDGETDLPQLATARSLGIGTRATGSSGDLQVTEPPRR
jgi:competence protein ComEC